MKAELDKTIQQDAPNKQQIALLMGFRWCVALTHPFLLGDDMKELKDILLVNQDQPVSRPH